MPGVVVDGMDAIAVYESTHAAIERAKNGDGPTLLECKTYRFFDHVGVRGMGLSYRSDEELEEWQKRDPIHMFEARLDEIGVLSLDQSKAIHDEVLTDVQKGIEFAESSPMPDPSTLLDDVYA